MKTCSKCKLEFPKTLEFFHKKLEGLHFYCKSCVKEINKAYRLANPEKLKQIHKAWSLANPENIRASSRKWDLANTEKKAEIGKIYYLANSEKVKARQKAYSLANPDKGNAKARKRRARIKGNEYIPYTEQQVLETYGIDCNICNLPIDLNTARQVGIPGWQNGLHIDHLIPISKGGPDTLENVRPTHGLCNITKNNKEQYEIKMA